MRRRTFNKEFKLEAVRLVKERGVSVAQAARDLEVHPNVLRNWIKEVSADPRYAFPGQGRMKPEQLETERRRRRAGEKPRIVREMLVTGAVVGAVASRDDHEQPSAPTSRRSCPHPQVLGAVTRPA